MSARLRVLTGGVLRPQHPIGPIWSGRKLPVCGRPSSTGGVRHIARALDVLIEAPGADVRGHSVRDERVTAASPQPCCGRCIVDVQVHGSVVEERSGEWRLAEEAGEPAYGEQLAFIYERESLRRGPRTCPEACGPGGTPIHHNLHLTRQCRRSMWSWGRGEA
jgi:hypothetical protein